MDNLPPLYTMEDVAEALGMSERWVRLQVAKGVPHTAPGRRIRFTKEQYDAFVASYARNETPRSITTGRKRKTA